MIIENIDLNRETTFLVTHVHKLAMGLFVGRAKHKSLWSGHKTVAQSPGLTGGHDGKVVSCQQKHQLPDRCSRFLSLERMHCLALVGAEGSFTTKLPKYTKWIHFFNCILVGREHVYQRKNVFLDLLGAAMIILTRHVLIHTDLKHKNTNNTSIQWKKIRLT